MTFISCCIREFYYQDRHFSKTYQIVLGKSVRAEMNELNDEQASELVNFTRKHPENFSEVTVVQDLPPVDIFDKIRHPDNIGVHQVLFDSSMKLSSESNIEKLSFVPVGIFL